MKSLSSRKSGFTLIELLVAMSIIAVLAAMGLASYGFSQKRARDARRRADVEAVRSALEIYRADNPATGYPLGNEYQNLCCGLGTPLENYLSALPLDPINDAIYKYTYKTGEPANYELCAAQLEQTGTSYCLSPP